VFIGGQFALPRHLLDAFGQRLVEAPDLVGVVVAGAGSKYGGGFLKVVGEARQRVLGGVSAHDGRRYEPDGGPRLGAKLDHEAAILALTQLQQRAVDTFILQQLTFM
jgi:hypothetical protein